MKRTFERQIIAELMKHGWEVDPKDNTNVIIARLVVKTFRGIDFAEAHPVTVFDDGVVAVKAAFISKGENTLALCRAYIKTIDEIPARIADFNTEVSKHLSQAFSVRIAA
jgi:hypothetical protein